MVGLGTQKEQWAQVRRGMVLWMPPPGIYLAIKTDDFIPHSLQI